MLPETLRKNFLIVSTGRTGTKWLADIMNQSRDWTVFHEPRGFRGDGFNVASFIFKNPYYGEVNGALRDDFHKFKIPKAIISRNVKELVLSFANRYPPSQMIKRIQLFNLQNEALRLKHLAEPKAPVFDFAKMTSDLLYLQSILDWAGIKDYKARWEDIKVPKNQTIVKKFKTFDDLPREWRIEFNKQKIRQIKPTWT